MHFRMNAKVNYLFVLYVSYNLCDYIIFKTTPIKHQIPETKYSFFNQILNTNFVLFLWLLVGTGQSILWYHLQKGIFSEPNASDYPLRTPLGVLASKSLLSITPQKQRSHVSAVKHLSNMNEVFCTMPPPHCIDMYNSN